QPTDPQDQPFLKQVYRLNEHTVIFDRNENESVAGVQRVLEGHLYNNGVAFILYLGFVDYTDPKYIDKKTRAVNAGLDEFNLNNKPQKLAEIQSLLARLKGRADNEVPTQPGVCIAEGFIRDDKIRIKENISFRYDLNDFIFAVNSDSAIRGEKSLLERRNEINPVMIMAGAHTLKKGQVTLPHINAEEWLIKAKQDISWPEQKTVTYYAFTLYGNEATADDQHPVFSVRLHNADLETKNYTDTQLVAIWDRITRTFRYRPGAF
ncbi:T6SS immunity protein Tli4 family protein, partial [Enterobacteriaceae bacterium LUAb1]